MLRRILVGLGSRLSAAAEARYAVELADRFGAALTGVTVLDARSVESVGPVPLGASEAATQLAKHRLEAARQHLDESVAIFEAACRDARVPFQVRREERADPFDRLISESRYHDFILCGLRGIFESGLIGQSPAESGEILARLVSSGVRPLLAAAPEYRPIRRVFVAYSGSVESAKTMKQFISLRPWLEVQVRIAVFGGALDRAERLLAGADEYCRVHGVAADLIHIPGSPHDQVVAAASDWNADLIVLGNSARNLLLRRVLGETALRVMQTSHLPLFMSQ